MPPKVEKDPLGNNGLVVENTAGFVQCEPMKLAVNISIPPYGTIFPADDITPKESALLSILLTALVSISGYYEFDVAGFVEQHKLQRHFKGAQQ